MYLSQLVVNVGTGPNRQRPGLTWIRNAYRIHQRLAMAFPAPQQIAADPFFIEPFSESRFFGDGSNKHVHVARNGCGGFLFRVETAQPPVILVQSAEQPNWDYGFANAGFLLARPPRVKLFQPDFADGQVWRFRLLANPTVKRQEKRHGLLHEDEQRAWLERKASAAGFDVRSVSIMQRGSAKVWRGRNSAAMTFLAVQFEGVLQVSDAVRLLEAFQQGIGSAKGFGFGLLSLAGGAG